MNDSNLFYAVCFVLSILELDGGCDEAQDDPMGLTALGVFNYVSNCGRICGKEEGLQRGSIRSN